MRPAQQDSLWMLLECGYGLQTEGRGFPDTGSPVRRARLTA